MNYVKASSCFRAEKNDTKQARFYMKRTMKEKIIIVPAEKKLYVIIPK